MQSIGAWRLPSPGTSARAQLDAYIESKKDDPETKRFLRERFDKALALITVQSVNGAGLRADVQLREFNQEYNQRVLNGSLRDMPSSFNVMEAFNEFIPDTSTFSLLKEKDHLFSFQHFIDWVTSSESAEEPNSHLVIKEGEIYSFTSTDRISDLCFSTSEAKEFGIGAVSMTRFGNEVSMLILAGQKADLEHESIKARDSWQKHKAAPHRIHILPEPSKEVQAEQLSDAPGLWKTIVLMRFDCETKTVDARYVMSDFGNSYAVTTDNIDAFMHEGKFITQEAKTYYEKSALKTQNYQALFELGKTFISLPKFHEENAEFITVRRYETNFKNFRTKLKNKTIVSLVNSENWLQYRNVYCLDKPNEISPERTSFQAPKFNIERRGYWKNLPINIIGQDKNGQPINGRTWVTETLSWTAQDPSEITTISAVKESAEGSEGYIYVMRSAAHAKNIFKIGLTRRSSELRAKELTRNSSAPDHFLTVQEWDTKDCAVAEKLIHKALDIYRVNPNREFFQAEYKIIFSAIQLVLSKMEGV